MRHLGWLLVVSACAHNVPQDKATGPDGKLRGATPIALAGGEGHARGIVTYPGGDRVDWKLIDVPKGPPGRLDLQLTWQAPRPGLQVAFDVFDEWGQPIVNATGPRRGRLRTATIDAVVAGKYFVRVYAPRRGDAGAYKLVAELKRTDGDEAEQKRKRDVLASIPDPPPLAGVPEPEQDCDQFDVKNKECKNKCPFDAPPTWPPCVEKEKREKAEADRIAAEKNRPPPPKPAIARVIDAKTVGQQSQVTLAIGTDSAPIDSTWTGEVLSKQTGKPIAGGSLILVRVGKTQTLAKSTLTIDQLTANPQVRLSPPSKP